MSQKKVLIIIKNRGIGDLCILASNIHSISRKIGYPVTVMAQKNTRADEIFKHDPHVNEVIKLDEKGFLNIIKKIKPKKFGQSYIFSDSIRLYIIAKLSGIKQIFHYSFFSKKGKNFFRTANDFTKSILNTEVNSQSKIFCNKNDVENAKKKYAIDNKTKNYVIAISASGPTKVWDINNYIRLLQELNKKYPSKFFIAAGQKDEFLIKRIMNSEIGKNCISLSKKSILEIIPIIGACEFGIFNDTGFAHIASGLGLKCLVLFMDSPPSAYGKYSNNITIVVPENESIESTGHNTRGKNQISFNEVLSKSLQLVS
ncbi:MAG TPA: hypothetical protein EYQ38_02770 [Candidatus Pelagibacter sp.]|jgi:ADP-heptose:LPS heptosyltransferase|nr:hypothetical protein [Candidatus Pelagibacter sp.]